MATPHASPHELALVRSNWVRALARRLARDPHLADDLIQDAWLAMASRGGPARDPAAWLAATVRNLARAQRRDGRRRRARERHAARTASAPPASAAAERADQLRAVVGEVLALAEPYRTTLLLRYVEELDVADVARRTGTTPGTARARISRGHALLRERLRTRFPERLGAVLLGLGRPGVAPTPWTALSLGVAMKIQAHAALTAAALLLVPLAWWVTRGEPQARQSATVEPVAALAPQLSELAEPAPARDEGKALADPAEPLEREAVAPPAPSAPPRAPAVAALAQGESWIEGRVVDGSGAALGGAQVSVHFPGGVPAPVQGATDEGGAYRFEELPDRREYDLLARAPGFASATIRTGPGLARNLVLARSTRLSGRVIERGSGRSVPGVVLRVFQPFPDGDGLARERTTVSDERGRYSFADLPSGADRYLEVLTPGTAPFSERVLLSQEADSEHDVWVEPGPIVEGQALDWETQAPLPTAVVRSGGPDGRVVARADARGIFSFRLDGGLAAPSSGPPAGLSLLPASVHRAIDRLFVEAPGYCPSAIDADDFHPGEPGPTPVPLLAASAVEGVVLDSDDQPVAGALLEWTELYSRWLGDGVHAQPGRDSLRVTSDDQGRFRMPTVVWQPPRHRSILAVHHGSQPPKRIADAVPDRAGVARFLEIRLGASRRLSGRVTFNGEPERAYVYYGPLGSEDTRQVRAGPGGRFELPDLEDGEWVVKACSGEGLALWSPEEVVRIADGDAPFLELSIEADLEFIQGRVLWEDGTPVVGQDVLAFPEGRFGGGLISSFATTNERGRFRLRFVDEPDQRFAVCVFHGGSTYSRNPVEPGEDELEFVLPRLGKLVVTAVATATGEPLGGVRLSWTLPSQAEDHPLFGGLEVPPDGAGRLELELPVGAIDLIVSAPSQDLAPRRFQGVVIRAEGVPAELHVEL